MILIVFNLFIKTSSAQPAMFDEHISDGEFISPE